VRTPILPPAPGADNPQGRSDRAPDSPTPPTGSPLAIWYARDGEARQRAEDRELLARICQRFNTTPERLARALLYLMAHGIAAIADGRAGA
jgi:hypothetical protein